VPFERLQQFRDRFRGFRDGEQGPQGWAERGRRRDDVDYDHDDPDADADAYAHSDGDWHGGV
jgi:hypothetical protein